MNIALLRLARRHRNGSRSWFVPGFPNAATFSPRDPRDRPSGPKFRWPGRDEGGEFVRSADLDRHRGLAKREARALINSVGVWKRCQDGTVALIPKTGRIPIRIWKSGGRYDWLILGEGSTGGQARTLRAAKSEAVIAWIDAK